LHESGILVDIPNVVLSLWILLNFRQRTALHCHGTPGLLAKVLLHTRRAEGKFYFIFASVMVGKSAGVAQGIAVFLKRGLLMWHCANHRLGGLEIQQSDVCVDDSISNSMKESAVDGFRDVFESSSVNVHEKLTPLRWAVELYSC